MYISFYPFFWHLDYFSILTIVGFVCFLQSIFRFMENLSRNCGDFPYALSPHTGTASPIINIAHQSGTFVLVDELPLTHLYHSRFIVYIRIHSWFCAFCGFQKLYDVISASLQHCAENIYCLKNPLCSVYSSLPITSDNHWQSLPTIFMAFAFPAHSIIRVKQCSFQIGFFHLAICIKFPLCLFLAWKSIYFLVLNTNPLSGYIIAYLFTCEGHLGWIQLWAIF